MRVYLEFPLGLFISVLTGITFPTITRITTTQLLMPFSVIFWTAILDDHYLLRMPSDQLLATYDLSPVVIPSHEVPRDTWPFTEALSVLHLPDNSPIKVFIFLNLNIFHVMPYMYMYNR